MGGNLAGKFLQRSTAPRLKTSARVPPLCTKQIANHMLCLELLAKSMASRGKLAIEWGPSFLSRCVLDARANGIPVPWACRVQANLHQVRVCISGRNVNGAIAAVDDEVEVANGLVQLADAPSQMPGVQTQSFMSILRHALDGTVFALHDIVK